MPVFQVKWIELFKNQTSNDIGAIVQLPVSRDYNLYSSGNFDGGTASLEWSTDGVTFNSVIDCQGVALTLTDPVITTFLKFSRQDYVRAVLTGAGGSADLSMEMRY